MKLKVVHRNTVMPGSSNVAAIHGDVGKPRQSRRTRLKTAKNLNPARMN